MLEEYSEEEKINEFSISLISMENKLNSPTTVDGIANIDSTKKPNGDSKNDTKVNESNFQDNLTVNLNQKSPNEEDKINEKGIDNIRKVIYDLKEVPKLLNKKRNLSEKSHMNKSKKNSKIINKSDNNNHINTEPKLNTFHCPNYDDTNSLINKNLFSEERLLQNIFSEERVLPNLFPEDRFLPNDNSLNSINFFSTKNQIHKDELYQNITLEKKNYNFYINKGILKECNQDEEYSIYNDIFGKNQSIIDDDSIKTKDLYDLYFIHKNIELTVFNHETFKKNNRNGIKKKESINVPAFIKYKDIIKQFGDKLKPLWNDKTLLIFDDEEDLLNIGEKGKILKKIYNYIISNKKPKEIKGRKTDVDLMVDRIRNNCHKSFLDATNSFEEFKFSPIKPISKDTINKHLDADFILEYLEQKLYSILPNDSSDTNGIKIYAKIEKIINDYNNNHIRTELIEHLCLTVQNYLDIFRYQKENSNCKYKLVDFLFDVFKETQKGKKKILISKIILLHLYY